MVLMMAQKIPAEITNFAKQLNTSLSGLTEQEAERRREKYGSNELKETRRQTPLRILVGQFTSNFIIYVLMAAGIISYIAHEIMNFYVILAIIVFVVFLGFVQEYRAERALQALKTIVRQNVRVLRDGQTKSVDSEQLVPGDVILLETGDKIPADAKIWETLHLKTDEASLTGESKPVSKHDGEDIYAGTHIVDGKCKALVYATGMSTRIGKIAGMIQEAVEETPLQKRIKDLSKTMTIIVFVAAAILIAAGTLQGASFLSILIVALAVAVAGVPEGLPLTLTLSLVLGMQKLAKENAIVRRVLAVETLGNVNIICTDKTGTLTKNEMTVEKVFVDGKLVNVTGKGYELSGSFLHGGKKIKPSSSRAFELLLRGAVLCNNASIERHGKTARIIGDPTEGALLVMAAKADVTREDAEDAFPRAEEIMFTSERKMMTTIHEGKKPISFTKGAPESVLSCCTRIMENGKAVKLTAKKRAVILETNAELASAALRVLALAYGEPKRVPDGRHEKNLVFLGLVAMKDPPREEVKSALEACKKAGIKVVMITGDNEHTAKAIAQEIGLIDHVNTISDSVRNNPKLLRIVKDHLITGEELNSLSDEEFDQVVDEIFIYARNMPENKLRIVNALKKKNYIVAMTGDGINDAPAIRKADIGIAMGIKGTDVTRETAQMVLADDNFATIAHAIEGGRAIFENIQKFTYYLVSTNFAEVVLISLGIFLLGFELLPLLALQILFLNLVTEEMPAVALGTDPPRRDVMRGPITGQAVALLSKRRLLGLLPLVLTMAGVTLAVFHFYLPEGLDKARTMALLTMVSFEVFNAFNFKSLDKSIFTSNVFGNKWLLLAIVGTFLATIAVLYIPAFQHAFSTVPLMLTDWVAAIVAASSVILLVELQKATWPKRWANILAILVRGIRVSKPQ